MWEALDFCLIPQVGIKVGPLPCSAPLQSHTSHFNHTLSSRYPCCLTQTHRHTVTHTHEHACRHTHERTHKQTHTHTNTCTHARAHTQTHTNHYKHTLHIPFYPPPITHLHRTQVGHLLDSWTQSVSPSTQLHFKLLSLPAGHSTVLCNLILLYLKFRDM